MSAYKVMWEIDVDAENPQAAAEEALRIQRDQDSVATVFVVTDARGERLQIDVSSVDLFGSTS